MDSISYISVLEDCIKNELLPVYNRFYTSQNLEPPVLTIEHLKVKTKQVPALFRSPEVLAFPATDE
jgi:hypothetical protein